MWEGDGVVKSARKLIGATNPLEAEPGTIRGDLAVWTSRNVVHGSDSIESGERETGLLPRAIGTPLPVPSSYLGYAVVFTSPFPPPNRPASFLLSLAGVLGLTFEEATHSAFQLYVRILQATIWPPCSPVKGSMEVWEGVELTGVCPPRESPLFNGRLLIGGCRMTVVITPEDAGKLVIPALFPVHSVCSPLLGLLPASPCSLFLAHHDYCLLLPFVLCRYCPFLPGCDCRVLLLPITCHCMAACFLSVHGGSHMDVCVLWVCVHMLMS